MRIPLRLVSIFPWLIVTCVTVLGNTYRIDSRSQWEEWNVPPGLLEFEADGSMTPVRYLKKVNVAPEAPDFVQESLGGAQVRGGVWKVGSGRASKDRIIDDDPSTYWQPDSGDALEDWWIEINLGRTVAVSKIRLIFPDREGARPLREFRLFVASGIRIAIKENIHAFELVAGTTRYNDQTSMEFDLASIPDQSDVLITGDRLHFSSERSEESDAILDETNYRMVQYIRLRVDAKTADAALAEVQVFSPADNIAMGTRERGGTFVESTGRGISLTDGDFNSSWGIQTFTGHVSEWQWDLGGLFWIDRIIMVGAPPSHRQLRRIEPHQLFASDGGLKLNGEIDFKSLHELKDGDGRQEIQYLMATPQRIRHLSTLAGNRTGTLVEIGVFARGYPAQVELTSPFIDLGAIAGDDRPKQIRAITWEVEQPEDTSVLLRTRSGTTLAFRSIYHHRDGQVITKEEFDLLNKFLKGEVDTFQDVSEDWSAWSTLYQSSGQGFLSPTPRRFMQMKLLLVGGRPEAAVTMHGLQVEFVDALLDGVVAEVFPRNVEPGAVAELSYRIKPRFERGNRGFDLIRLDTPSGAEGVRLSVAGVPAELDPGAVQIAADSVIIELPREIQTDSVEVQLNMRFNQSPTIFTAAVGHTETPGLWQPVDPSGLRSTAVFFLELPDRDRLINDLAIRPRIASPNGDGVNDQVEIRFAVLNPLTAADVTVYTLDGRFVTQLQSMPGGDGRDLYVWAGTDRAGSSAPPGLYLCRIEVDTQSGLDAVTRVIALGY